MFLKQRHPRNQDDINAQDPTETQANNGTLLQIQNIENTFTIVGEFLRDGWTKRRDTVSEVSKVIETWKNRPNNASTTQVN